MYIESSRALRVGQVAARGGRNRAMHNKDKGEGNQTVNINGYWVDDYNARKHWVTKERVRHSVSLEQQCPLGPGQVFVKRRG